MSDEELEAALAERFNDYAAGMRLPETAKSRFVGALRRRRAVRRMWTVGLIGLTVIAAGTSLPELASAIASARHGQNELTLGNIIGSNFFNALAVVGTSGAISPFRDVSPLVFTRDLPVMVLLTLSIGIFGFSFRRPRSPGTITRPFGIIWLLAFFAYLIILIRQEAFTA